MLSNAHFVLYLCVYAMQCGWYWGAMSFDEAEAMLANRRDGSFLVRDSSDERYILSLSFRSLGGTHHTRIEHYKGIKDMIVFRITVSEISCFPVWRGSLHSARKKR